MCPLIPENCILGDLVLLLFGFKFWEVIYLVNIASQALNKNIERKKTWQELWLPFLFSFLIPVIGLIMIRKNHLKFIPSITYSQYFKIHVCIFTRSAKPLQEAGLTIERLAGNHLLSIVIQLKIVSLK